MDGAVVDPFAARKLGCGKQPLVVEMPDGEEPLAHSFGAHPQADQLERAREARIGPRFGDVVVGRGVAGNRDRADVAQLLVGEEAVEVGLAGDAQVVGAAAGGFTLSGERPPVPVCPSGFAPLFG